MKTSVQFLIVSRSALLRVRKISNKSYRENKKVNVYVTRIVVMRKYRIMYIVMRIGYIF
jgi:hypothetical protein